VTPVLDETSYRTARATRGALRVGFVPLLDAAPLIAAFEIGAFARAGLNVTLERQVGWGNVRAKLAYGQLHASHALVGMPPESLLGREGSPEPLVTLMSLGVGGNAITLAKALVNAGVTSAADLGGYVRTPGFGPPLLLAHVFGCSTHHYALRAWLAAGRVDLDRHALLCVLPPPQMTRQLHRGGIHGFCCGEPWNTVAEREGLGRVVAWTTELFPAHPEKVLAVGRSWLSHNASAAEALVRAALQGCAFASDPANAKDLAAMLARPEYLNLPIEILSESLARVRSGRWDCSPAAAAPAASHAEWLLRQMGHHGHLPPATDIAAVARQSVDAAAYQRAVGESQSDGSSLTAPVLPPMKERA
jgi:ABC-type nitrate/sulfonate/bicarbonate transport system substrate-binding protein